MIRVRVGPAEALCCMVIGGRVGSLRLPGMISTPPATAILEGMRGRARGMRRGSTLVGWHRGSIPTACAGGRLSLSRPPLFCWLVSA